MNIKNQEQKNEALIGGVGLNAGLGLVDDLRTEADLCRNETADDIADLLDAAANEIERMNGKVLGAHDGRLNDVESVAHRLALELECLLMDTKDLSVQSKWWDSAHVALEQWHALDQRPHVSAMGAD